MIMVGTGEILKLSLFYGGRGITTYKVFRIRGFKFHICQMLKNEAEYFIIFVVLMLKEHNSNEVFTWE